MCMQAYTHLLRLMIVLKEGGATLTVVKDCGLVVRQASHNSDHQTVRSQENRQLGPQTIPQQLRVKCV